MQNAPPPRKRSNLGLTLLTVAFGVAVLGSIGLTGAVVAGAFDEAEPVVAVDAGPPDAGPPDAGPPDAGPPDAGPPDAGPPDAGPPDAGVDAFVPPAPEPQGRGGRGRRSIWWQRQQILRQQRGF